jgi:cytochrome P450
VAVIPKKLKENYPAHKDLMKSKALHRLNRKTDRLDFMTRMADPNSGLSVEQFVASSDTVLLGGSETTSTLLSGVTYCLVQHPKTLEKLVQEIRSKFTSEDQIDLPGVNSLDYMLACLQETFRLYPPVPGALPRRTREGDIFAGKYVPPNVSALSALHTKSILDQSLTFGCIACWPADEIRILCKQYTKMTVAIYQWAMYRLSKHFSRTLEYIPERWMGDPEFANDNRSSLQPFSVGARNCISRK